MRLARLLLVAILVLMAGRTVASQEINSQSLTRHDYVRPFVAQQTAPDADGLVRAKPAERNWSYGDDRSNGSEVCLTLHTLQVAREDGSDVTHLVSQRTCTPARQFEMKSAVIQNLKK